MPPKVPLDAALNVTCPCCIMRPPASSNCSTKLTVSRCGIERDLSVLHHEAASQFQLFDEADGRGATVDMQLTSTDRDPAVGIGDTPQRGRSERQTVILLEDRDRGPAERGLGKVEAQGGAIAKEVIANVNV